MLFTLLLACPPPPTVVETPLESEPDTGTTQVDSGLDDTGSDSGGPGDSGDLTDTAPTQPTLDRDLDAITRLANRLAAAQNDDGSYDWVRPEDQELDPTATGYQNVTGVSAWGFFNALELAESELWSDALADTTDYFDALLGGAATDPESSGLSCPNYTVLAWQLSAHPDAGLEDRALDAFDAMLDERDATHGTDDTQRIDGLLNYLVERRAGYPGLIPWDLALCVEATRELGGLSAELSADATDAEAWLAAYTAEIFLPAYDADAALDWADITLGYVLAVLATGGDPGQPLLAELQGRLEDLVSAEGEISNGSTDDGPHQGTAYGLMGLKAVQSDRAQQVQTHAEGLVDAEGMVIGDGVETFEISGELLRALAE